MRPPALHVQNLSVSLGGRRVLHDLSLALPAGRWISVVGPNGAGKSTLLKAMAGLLPATGEIAWHGQELPRLTPRVRAQQLAWLGQGESVTDDLQVWDVVMLGRLPHQDWWASPTEVDAHIVTDCLRATQAWDWRGRTLGQLSSGERQRVLLARLLAVQANTLLMDEPLANLDPPHQVDWLHQVRQAVTQGQTVVSVLHEIGMALQADDVVVMREGRIVHHGPCAEAATQRAIEAVFDHRLSLRTLDGQVVALPVVQS